MNVEYLRGKFVSDGIELCIEPKRSSVKATLKLDNALGKKKFSKTSSFSMKDSCWWHTECCLSSASSMILSHQSTKDVNHDIAKNEEQIIANILTAVGLLL